MVTDSPAADGETELDHAEPCANCGDAVVTTPGMDNHVVVRYNGVTEYSEEYYCNEVCLTEGVA